MLPNDMRYRIICSFPGCFKHLGDWALHVPVSKRLCFNHKQWDLKKEISHLKSKSASITHVRYGVRK
jgi:hypothetical protein